MNIGLIPAICVNGDIEANLKQIKKYLNIAYKKNIDFIFFGESFLQGFDSLNWAFDMDKKIAVKKDSDIINSIKNEARKLHVGIGFGYFELSRNFIYSSYLVISKEGEALTNYRRISKGWKDNSKADSHYCEGKKIEVFNIDSHRFTIALCGDLWYDELFSMLRTNSVRNTSIIWPVHVDYSKEAWKQEIIEYHQRALIFSDNVFLVNNILNPNAHGGAFNFNQFGYDYIDFDTEDILVIDLEKEIAINI